MKIKEKKTVYADNAATTAMSDAAVAAMLPFMKDVYGNPSSLHTAGQAAKEALESARAHCGEAQCRTARNIFYFWRKRSGQSGDTVGCRSG